MGLGWFGLSTFWLLPLVWRMVGRVLAGDRRIFGRGSLRVWMGTVLVLGASATLEALTGGDGEGAAAGGAVGHALAGTASGMLGWTGALLMMLAVLGLAAPMVFGETWRSLFLLRKPRADADEEPVAPKHASRVDARSDIRAADPRAADLRTSDFRAADPRGDAPAKVATRDGVERWETTSLPSQPAPGWQPPRHKSIEAVSARRQPAWQPPPRTRESPPQPGEIWLHHAEAPGAVKREPAMTPPASASAPASARPQAARADVAPPSKPQPKSDVNVGSKLGSKAEPKPAARAESRSTPQATVVSSPFRNPQLGLRSAITTLPEAKAQPAVAVAPAPVAAAMAAPADTDVALAEAPDVGLAVASAVAPVMAPAAQPSVEVPTVARATERVADIEKIVVAPVALSDESADKTVDVVAEDAAQSEPPVTLDAIREEALALLAELRMLAGKPIGEAALPVAIESPAEVETSAAAEPVTDAAKTEVAAQTVSADLAVAEVVQIVQTAQAVDAEPAEEEGDDTEGDAAEAAAQALEIVTAAAYVEPADPVESVDPVEPVLPSQPEPSATEDIDRAVAASISEAEAQAEADAQAEAQARAEAETGPKAAAIATPATDDAFVLSAEAVEPSEPDEPAPVEDANAFVQPAPKPRIVLQAVVGRTVPLAAAPVPATPAPVAAVAPVAPPAPRVVVDYRLPAAELLEPADEAADERAEQISEERLQQTGELIAQRLAEFKVPVSVVGASAGPVITRFEVDPAVGVRGAQVVGLMKDLARALGVTSIRVVETIPGKTCMGLELPNAKRQMIRLSEIVSGSAFHAHASKLVLAMGKDITGHPVVTDLARAPHLLVAGTTGSGKSVAVNAMILSMLYKATPEDVRLIMIDPKMLELSVYEGIPHLLAPVVTDMKQAAHALNWCVGEMEKRYRLMSALGVRNLAGYNQKIRAAEAAEQKVPNPFSLTPDAPEPLSTLPLIVVVIDELADLMMVAGKKIEELIARLAQKARAAGIHLILATQRPSVDVITGLIKANIPTRVAFQVSSKIDSRTILDQMGAESLLGQGDMLFLPPGTGYPQRVHGAFVADEEVHRVVEHWKQFGEPDYDEAILAGDAPEGGAADLFGENGADGEADPLYDEAAQFVLTSRRASISAVQRQLRIGYNRAARLIEQMEVAGLVSAMGRNGTREVTAPGGPAD